MTERNEWKPRSIYLYLVCLITLVMTIFSLVNVVRAVAEFAYPEPAPLPVVRMLSPGYEAPEISQEEQEQQREYQAQWAQRTAALNLVRNLSLMLVAAPLYLYHWRQIGRETAAAREASRRTDDVR